MLAAQSLTLPLGIVRVLNLQLFEGVLLASTTRDVPRNQLFHEDAQRPSVRNDVVHRHREHMLLGVYSHEVRAKQGPTREVERPGRFRVEPGLELPRSVAALHPSEVVHAKGRGVVPVDDLHRLAALLLERGPERLVANHEVIESTA